MSGAFGQKNIATVAVSSDSGYGDCALCSDNLEVAIVYQRSCYIPSHFTSDADWETKLMIERSLAIVCPNIAYHLAGTKKVQQVLSQPGVIEKFIKDADAVHRIRNTFTEMFSLDMVEDFILFGSFMYILLLFNLMMMWLFILSS